MSILRLRGLTENKLSENKNGWTVEVGGRIDCTGTINQDGHCGTGKQLVSGFTHYRCHRVFFLRIFVIVYLDWQVIGLGCAN